MATSSLRLVFSYFHSRLVSLSSCQASAGGLLFPPPQPHNYVLNVLLLTVYCLAL